MISILFRPNVFIIDDYWFTTSLWLVDTDIEADVNWGHISLGTVPMLDERCQWCSLVPRWSCV